MRWAVQNKGFQTLFPHVLLSIGPLVYQALKWKVLLEHVQLFIEGRYSDKNFHLSARYTNYGQICGERGEIYKIFFFRS